MQIVFFSRVTLFVDMSQPFQDLHFHCLLLKWSENWVKIAQSCPTLCNPMDYTVHGILQARILEWVAFPFPRGSSQPRDWTQVSCIADGFFTSWATREALVTCQSLLFYHPHHWFFFFFAYICSSYKYLLLLIYLKSQLNMNTMLGHSLFTCYIV